jgi:hypothetical protein
MNTIRLIAFVAAVLIATFLLCEIAYSLTVAQTNHAVTATAASTQSTVD